MYQTIKTGREVVRIVLALLTAAFASATVSALLAIGEGNALATWAVFFIIALPHAVVLGLPAYFVLRKLHLVSWWISIVSGFIIGAVPLAILFWPTAGSEWPDFIRNVCIGGLMGTVGGFSAWLVWRFLPPPRTIE